MTTVALKVTVTELTSAASTATSPSAPTSAEFMSLTDCKAVGDTLELASIALLASASASSFTSLEAVGLSAVASKLSSAATSASELTSAASTTISSAAERGSTVVVLSAAFVFAVAIAAFVFSAIAFASFTSLEAAGLSPAVSAENQVGTLTTLKSSRQFAGVEAKQTSRRR